MSVQTMTMPAQVAQQQQQPINYQVQMQQPQQQQSRFTGLQSSAPAPQQIIQSQPAIQPQPLPQYAPAQIQNVSPQPAQITQVQQQQYAQQIALQQSQQFQQQQQSQYTSPQPAPVQPQLQAHAQSPQPMQYAQQPVTAPHALAHPGHTVLGGHAPTTGAHVKREKSVALKEWTGSVERNVGLFEDASKVIINKHQKSHIKTGGFSESLKQISTAETCGALQHALQVLAGNINEAEKHRLILLGQLQAHVVERFAKYESKIEVQKHNIKSRNSAYNKLLSKLKDYNNVKQQHKSETKIQHSKELLDAEAKRMSSNEATLNMSVKQFEQQRIEEMKLILKRYVQGQIYFMSRSIEGLSTSYAAICNIDSEKEADALIATLQLCEYNGGTQP